MATIKDISRELNLGVSTVSMALNGNPRISKATRELVLKKAKELKYVKNTAAVDLQKGKTNLILLVVNDPARTFFAETINRIQREVARHGYDFLIATTFEGHDETAKRYIKERRADAVIVYTSTISEAFIIENASESFPIFILGRKICSEHVYSFQKPNDVQSEGVNYLIEKGHQHIAFVKGSPYSLGTQRKFKGYLAGLRDHGLPIDETLIFDANGSDRMDGYRITEKIIPHISELDAIIYSNDEIAIGGMECLKKHQINIPEDVSILGSNNSPLAEYISPKLTSVGSNYSSDTFPMLIDALVALIEGADVQKQIQALSDMPVNMQIAERETVSDRRKNKADS